MSLKITAVHLIANAAAWLVSCRRELVRHKLTDDECEAAGLPHGSTDPAVHVQRPAGASAWRVDAWLDREEQREGCLRVDVLGHHIEVFYLKAPAVREWPTDADPQRSL